MGKNPTLKVYYQIIIGGSRTAVQSVYLKQQALAEELIAYVKKNNSSFANRNLVLSVAGLSLQTVKAKLQVLVVTLGIDANNPILVELQEVTYADEGVDPSGNPVAAAPVRSRPTTFSSAESSTRSMPAQTETTTPLMAPPPVLPPPRSTSSSLGVRKRDSDEPRPLPTRPLLQPVRVANSSTGLLSIAARQSAVDLTRDDVNTTARNMRRFRTRLCEYCDSRIDEESLPDLCCICNQYRHCVQQVT